MENSSSPDRDIFLRRYFHEQSLNQFSQLAAMKEERISQFLTPEQKEELVKLAEEREELFAKHGPPPGM